MCEAAGYNATISSSALTDTQLHFQAAVDKRSMVCVVRYMQTKHVVCMYMIYAAPQEAQTQELFLQALHFAIHEHAAGGPEHECFRQAQALYPPALYSCCSEQLQQNCWHSSQQSSATHIKQRTPQSTWHLGSLDISSNTSASSTTTTPQHSMTLTP